MVYSVSNPPAWVLRLINDRALEVETPTWPPAKQQAFSRSCGAVSLLCVAKELGLEKIPVFVGSMSEKLGCDTLELDSRCEEDLYSITSGFTTHRQHCADLTDADYSMPDGIVTAGRLLGLKMTVEENPTVFSKALNWFYPAAKSRLHGMGCAVVHGPSMFEANQIKIEALAQTYAGLPVALHWVVRSDGSYMDPATGKNQPDFSALNAGLKEASSKEKHSDRGYFSGKPIPLTPVGASKKESWLDLSSQQGALIMRRTTRLAEG